MNEADGVLNIVNHDESASLVLRLAPNNGARRVTLYKEKGFKESDVDHIIRGYRAMCSDASSADSFASRGFGGVMPSFSLGGAWRSPSEDSQGAPGRGNTDPVAELEGMGVRVYRPSQSSSSSSSSSRSSRHLTWEALAGYHDVKRHIDDTVIKPMKHPEVYDRVARETRGDDQVGSSRPKAVLFEGPPGTGKTLSARIIASTCGHALVHLPVESVVSKWFGESEKKLARVLELTDELPDGAVIFIDEIDGLTSSRDSGQMHEASRRMLSVLLQALEGFRGRSKTLLVCATNRRQDLDAALLSRFDLSVTFPLPDHATRAAVFGSYARQLGPDDVDKLAQLSPGFSCRDIVESSLDAERRWASKLLKHEAGVGKGHHLGDAPDLQTYLSCVEYRASTKQFDLVSAQPGQHNV